MKVETEKIYNTEFNSKIYNGWRNKFEDLFKSEKYVLKKTIFSNTSILDIGCACGDLSEAISSINPQTNYTGIDVDKKAIKIGKKRFPKIDLIQGFFPSKKLTGKKFDLVLMEGLFPQIPDWKKALMEMVKLSKRFISMTVVVRLDGTTVIDKDVSYFYYLDSGKRVYQVVHNLFELLNFCCIHEINAKEVWFYGYHKIGLPKSNNYRCIPESEQVVGNILIELNNKKTKRFNGVSHKKVIGKLKKVYFKPTVNIIIDGKASVMSLHEVNSKEAKKAKPAVK